MAKEVNAWSITIDWIRDALCLVVYIFCNYIFCNYICCLEYK